MVVRSYIQIRQSVLDTFKKSFPHEEAFSAVFGEWLLDQFCNLDERYELYREFNREKK